MALSSNFPSNAEKRQIFDMNHLNVQELDIVFCIVANNWFLYVSSVLNAMPKTQEKSGYFSTFWTVFCYEIIKNVLDPKFEFPNSIY